MRITAAEIRPPPWITPLYEVTAPKHFIPINHHSYHISGKGEEVTSNDVMILYTSCKLMYTV